MRENSYQQASYELMGDVLNGDREKGSTEMTLLYQLEQAENLMVLEASQGQRGPLKLLYFRLFDYVSG